MENEILHRVALAILFYMLGLASWISYGYLRNVLEALRHLPV